MMQPTVSIGDSTLPARVAESRFQQARGHMFRRKPPEWALVFDGADGQSWHLHMLFVPFPLDAVFVEDGRVKTIAEMSPWTGSAAAEADAVIELPHGAVDAEVGMEVRLNRAETENRGQRV